MSTAQGTRLVAAAFTPFDEQGRVDPGALKAHWSQLQQQHVDAVFVCGTTGEGVLLTGEERRRVAQQWVELASDSGVDVIVHVGHAAPGAAADLASHAQSIGAAAISAIAPAYFKPASTDDLVAVCAQIAAAAPDLPFFYYHAPGLSGVQLPMAQFLRAAQQAIPNFGGIKFTHDDLRDFAACLDVSEGQMYFGRDENLLAALATGATGAIGSTYCFMGPLYRQVIEAFRVGDLAAARAHQATARRIIDIGLEFGGLPAFKAIALSGAGVGTDLRIPNNALPSDALRALWRRLNEGGLLAAAGIEQGL